jgi:hypothetical protein
MGAVFEQSEWVVSDTRECFRFTPASAPHRGLDTRTDIGQYVKDECAEKLTRSSRNYGLDVCLRPVTSACVLHVVCMVMYDAQPRRVHRHSVGLCRLEVIGALAIVKERRSRRRAPLQSNRQVKVPCARPVCLRRFRL